MEDIKVMGSRFAKKVIRSPTPMLAEYTTPRLLIMAVMIRKDRLLKASWAAIGVPRHQNLSRGMAIKMKAAKGKSKGQTLLSIINNDKRALSPCAETVAMAAPEASMPSSPTSSRSPEYL